MHFDSSGGLVWVGDEKVHFMLHSVFSLLKNHLRVPFIHFVLRWGLDNRSFRCVALISCHKFQLIQFW